MPITGLYPHIFGKQANYYYLKMFTFNPTLKEYKSVRGAITTEQKLNLTVAADCEWVNLLIAKDGFGYNCYSMIKSSQGSFFVSVELNEDGLYFYHFETENGVYGASNDLTAIHQQYYNYCDYQLTVTVPGYDTPSLLKGGVIYQIFPDRFCRIGNKKVGKGKVLQQQWGAIPTYRNAAGYVLNNEFFGGNFKGIMSKLDYLKSLGVTVIYLNPISKSFSSHRYDTGDYLTPDPLLGTEKDLKELLSAAEEKGISFVFDGVYNHTGADSVYFNKYSNYLKNGAFNTKDSPYYQWYDFDSFPNAYRSWWNFDTLPSIKKDCESYQSFITEIVLPHYFKLGFKGVRLDVVDELSSDFVEKIRRSVKKYGAVVIGEVWEDPTNKIAYGERRKYFSGNQLDSVMNYHLKSGICDYLLHGNTEYLVHVLTSQVNNFPKCALDNLMNILSTHDTVRIINNLGRKNIVTDKDKLKDTFLSEEELNRGKKLAKIAYALVYTLYGSPSVYYGDEVALTGDLDPYNRRCFPWGQEDSEYLSYFEKLGKIRTENEVFVSGDFNIVYYDKKVLVYERTDGKQRIVVAVTLTKVPVGLEFSQPVVSLLDDEKTSVNSYTLSPESVAIFKQLT